MTYCLIQEDVNLYVWNETGTVLMFRWNGSASLSSHRSLFLTFQTQCSEFIETIFLVAVAVEIQMFFCTKKKQHRVSVTVTLLTPEIKCFCEHS